MLRFGSSSTHVDGSSRHAADVEALTFALVCHPVAVYAKLVYKLPVMDFVQNSFAVVVTNGSTHVVVLHPALVL